MLRYLLDTDLCVRVIRERSAFYRQRFEEERGGLAVSTIVVTELLVGAANSMWPERNKEMVARLVSSFAVLPFDMEAAEHAADIRAELERQGRKIGPHDSLIAGHARSRGLIVVTGNIREFSRVDGLRCENWLPERDGFHED
jgi:tRNA(fMet)-specific endonuclease VapC